MRKVDFANLTRDDLIYFLKTEDRAEIERLWQVAYDLKMKIVGQKVYYRGIIEFSNICAKNCYYCGIRHDNKNVERFRMTEEEILECAELAWKMNYGSLVLQSGERMDEEFIGFVERILKKIKEMSNGELGITLSLGEQTEETYQRWFAAGAHRYLLRIETSNPALYRSLHPQDHDFDFRFECLKSLRKTGYQVGTGVMIGLPGQTAEMLADDIIFFKDQDIDMIGMGPYIPHPDTPLAAKAVGWNKEKQLQLGLKMIALTRLYLQDVNIASTTALQALHHEGREFGLKAGANIIMPNITHTKYRDNYKLYKGKPCTDENAGMCRACLEGRIGKIGEEIGYNEWGDSIHFEKRVTQSPV
ncbi:MAG TPA: [FeFe] hydrogenase H-cluster radical SAM maturase HydE [Candidatus Cloacimonadota bacterium]|nr:[FeFe] hydrogenase H-cluster radical SAM maturase HydE [Candidatus Cloacimonadota bacterium]